MGRRALRKTDAQLDLSAFYWEIEDPAARVEFDSLFPNRGPVEVEVGSGKGLFLANAAAERSDRNFLGIEISRKYARFAAARLAKHQLRNGKVISADAIRLFGEAFSNDCAAAVHVYFPDPWWKKRHHKRRLMTAEFVGHVERVLQPGGRLHFWTDVHDYFQASMSLISEHTGLSGPFSVCERDPDHDLDYRTHFERRTRLEGMPVFRAEFCKS